jgi:hypothetical protein
LGRFCGRIGSVHRHHHSYWESCDASSSSTHDDDTLRRRPVPSDTVPFVPQTQAGQGIGRSAIAWKLLLQVGIDNETFLTLEIGRELILGRASGPETAAPTLDLTAFGATAHGVSRRHAIITVGRAGLCLQDAGSLNGTLVNGFALDPARVYLLSDGDEITLGTLRLIMKLAQPATP